MRGRRARRFLVPLVAGLTFVGSLVAIGGGSAEPSGATVTSGHFPIGLYHVGFGVASDPNDDVHGAQLIADLEDIHAAGFNLVSAMPDETDQVAFLSRAQQLGVDIIYSKDGTDQDWDQVIPVIKNSPALVGVVHGDDVNVRDGGSYNYPLPQAKADFQTRKQQAPNLAVYLSGGGHQSYGNLKLWSPYADLIGVQSYPVCNETAARTLTQHWAYMQRAYSRLAAKGQPWYLNGQAFSWDGACATRVPTRNEYRNMMFAALLNKASGILNYTYFDGAGRLPTLHPQFWSEITQFNGNIRAIEPFLLNGQLTRLSNLKGGAHGGYWRNGNDLLIVVLNANRKSTRPIRLTLPSGFTQPLTPAFASYPTGLTNSGGTVTGSIGPDAVQVYRTTRS
jgi:hypothetical protein